MHILQLLTERTIRIPIDLKQKGRQVLINAYVNYALHVLKGAHQDKTNSMINFIEDHYNIRTERTPKEVTTNRISYSAQDLPQSYKKVTKRGRMIQLNIGNIGENKGGFYYSDRGSHTIEINIPKNIQIRNGINDPATAIDQISMLSSALDHEFAHAIQYDFLRKINPREFDVSYYGDDEDGAFDFQKYHTSRLEFSPLIKTSAGEFVYTINRMSKNNALTHEHVRALFNQFVNPKYTVPEGYPSINTSKFFASLYDNDKKLWKKAVKDFQKEVTARL